MNVYTLDSMEEVPYAIRSYYCWSSIFILSCLLVIKPVKSGISVQRTGQSWMPCIYPHNLRSQDHVEVHCSRPSHLSRYCNKLAQLAQGRRSPPCRVGNREARAPRRSRRSKLQLVIQFDGDGTLSATHHYTTAKIQDIVYERSRSGASEPARNDS